MLVVLSSFKAKCESLSYTLILSMTAVTTPIMQFYFKLQVFLRSIQW